MNPTTDFRFALDYDGKTFVLDTREVREAVAPIPLNHPEISAWIRDCLKQNIDELHGGVFYEIAGGAGGHPRQMLEQVSLRKGDNIDTRIVVGMATCGIAAGAPRSCWSSSRSSSAAESRMRRFPQTGCVGVCRLEPIVEVYVKGQEKVTYVHMTPEKVARVVNDHIVNGRPVEEYTVGAQG